MHITRWLTLVSAAALVASCTAGGGARKGDPLEQDVSLAALEQQVGARPVSLAGAVVCQPETVSARPTASQQARAERLLELGKSAAMVGDTAAARELLRQAAYLDGTSREVAYQLARASETAGDTATAVREYCRYLSFGASSAELKEVRGRLLALSPVPALAPVASTGRAAARHAVRQGGVSAHARRSAASRVARAPTPAPDAASAMPVVREPATTPAPAGSGDGRDGAPVEGQANGAVVVDGSDGHDGASEAARDGAGRAEPTIRREPQRHTVRDAAIGAAIGAAAGAAVSKDVKGAVLGAAAGGLLGVVVGRPSRPEP